MLVAASKILPRLIFFGKANNFQVVGKDSGLIIANDLLNL